MDIKSIIESNIGSGLENGVLTVNFKKVVNTKQYETESVEASLTVPLGVEDIGKRFEVIEAVALAKVEYGVLFNLLATGRITQSEFDARKVQLVSEVEILSNYLGVSLNDLGVESGNTALKK